MSIENEQWKDIPGYEGKYLASNQGRVMSLRRVVKRLLSPNPASSGHLSVNLAGATAPVHLIILRTFVGPRPPGMIGRHLNGKCTDNRLANLEWNTQSVNRRDVKYHKGSKALMAFEVIDILKRLADGEGRRALAAEYDVDYSTIRCIDTGRTHKDITMWPAWAFSL